MTWQSSNARFIDPLLEKSETVLVLGAGSSLHCGYPLGEVLCQRVIENTSPENEPSLDFLKQMGFTSAQIHEFHEDFAASIPPSIDDFLTHRTEFANIGRACIAQELIKHEKLDRIRRPNGNWYRLLRSHILSLAESNEWGVTIVTFNYDRSIDRFIYDLIKSTHPKRLDSIWPAIRILHVHGSLGYLEEDSRAGFKRPYRSDATPEEVRLASESIRVIHELETDFGLDMQRAQRALKAAKRVLFLGFGFHSTNLSRLRIEDPFEGKNWLGESKFFGCAYRLSRRVRSELLANSQNRLSLADSGLDIEGTIANLDWWDELG